MKKLKKLISMLLLFTFMVVESPNLLAYAVDSSTSELAANNITITNLSTKILVLGAIKEEATPESKVIFNLNINNNVNKAAFVGITYKKPITGNESIVPLQFISSLGEYEGFLEINAYEEAGEWEAVKVDIVDIYGNLTTINSNLIDSIGIDLSNLNFKVSGTNSDIVGPKIDKASIKINKTSVKPGDYINVSVKATDDKSGVNGVYLYYKMPNSGETGVVEAVYNNGTQIYEAYIDITKYTESGKWQLIGIEAIDGNNNSTYITELSVGSFTVSGTTPDITSPSLDEGSINVDKPQVGTGEKVKLSFKATDAGSGIAIAYAAYVTPINQEIYPVEMLYNPNTKSYEGFIEITPGSEVGVWKIIEIGLIDNNGNYTIKNSTELGKFTVVTGSRPVISGAQDKTINNGSIFDPKASVTARDNENGDLTSKIVVSGTVDTKKAGVYKVTYSVTDNDGNKVTVERKITVLERKLQLNSLIGSDRYDTGVRLSKSQFTTANTVVIVNGAALVDGLAATPLATYKNAPLLLTANNALPVVSKDEIKRLGAKNAIIVGGTGVVNDSVIKELKTLGVNNITRIGGTDRYDTSLEIAKYIDKNCYDVSKVVISNGLGQADALSIASVAGRDKMPIILVKKDEVPEKVYSWLKSESLQDAYIIGGTGVVSTNVLTKVDGITASNVANNRLGGKDRYATNAMIIDKFYGTSIDKVYIAKGLELVDALAAGPVAALNSAPVILSGSDLTAEQKTVLNKRIANTIIRTGGGITDKSVNSLNTCLQ